MFILTEPISVKVLEPMAEKMFGNLVKGVVDVAKGALAVDAEMHADIETFLLENGSEQADLWGINLYPAQTGDDFIEFDSMINVRPGQGNRSRGVDDPETRKKIVAIVDKWVRR